MNEAAGRLDDREFFEAMTGDRDPMVFAIRGVAYVERELYRFIHSRVAVPSEIDKLHLELHAAVGLASALGLNRQVGSAIRAVASIRNKFAHRPDVALTAPMVRDLWKAMGDEEKSLIQTGWRRVRPDAAPIPGADDVAEMFCFIVVCLRAALTFECIAKPEWQRE